MKTKSRPHKARGLPTAVIDTTLFSRLVDLDIAERLPWLFKLILIPPEVKREAYRARGRRRLRKLMREMSDFFVTCHESDKFTQELMRVDLGDGEAAAIAQAEITKSVLLIDERKGSKRAVLLDLSVLGTANVLNLLKAKGAITAVKPYYHKLEKTGFYLQKDVRARFLMDAGEA